MNKLFQHTICPFSRQARVFLYESSIEVQIIEESFWLKRKDFLQLNQAANVPVLILEEEKLTLVGLYSILEYLREYDKDFIFMKRSETIHNLSEMRRYYDWFNIKLNSEVTKPLIEEKIMKKLIKNKFPNTTTLRIVRDNINQHMNFLSELLLRYNYIISEQVSCVDIMAACHISLIDYLGEINWDKWQKIKEWYVIVKSKPSFRSILKERIAGINPSKEYYSLDF